MPKNQNRGYAVHETVFAIVLAGKKNMKKKSLVVGCFIFANLVQAAIVCESPARWVHDYATTATIDEAARTVHIRSYDAAGKTLYEKEWQDLQTLYDGHSTTLMTAKGFSLKYEHHYGCVKEAILITDFNDRGFQKRFIPVCKGGTTPDEICGLPIP